MPTNRSKPPVRPSIQRFSTHETNLIYVGILTSHLLAAHHLASLVRANPNMCPVILEDGVRSVSALPPHGRIVIVIDLWGLALPVSEYLKAFTAAIPGCSFLALDKSRNVTDVAQFLRAGFAGFSSYDKALCFLGCAINAVAGGDIWTSTEAVRVYVDLTSQRTTTHGAAIRTLTAREAEVMDM